MAIIHNKKFLIVCCVLSFLGGCSGSTLDSETDAPAPKVLVNAGGDVSVDEQSTVILNVQASGQTDELRYSWSVTPDLPIVQEDDTLGTASFIAPSTSEVMTYTFRVDVTDASGNRGSDTVVYQVNPVNASPLAIIQVSPLLGDPSMPFPAGFDIVLDASSSDDIDSVSDSNPIAAYLWQQTAGEPVLGGISLQGDSLAFTTPIIAQANVITISLTVTDQEGAEDVETLTLNIKSAGETLPVVDAGVDHEVFSGESINLYGSASTSIAASEPLSFIWLNDSEKDPQVDDFNALQTAAIAPQVTDIETVTFTLRVKDARGNSVDDSLTVRIKPLPIQPLNDTGVILQATNSEILSDFQGDFPGQDGQRGQDIIHTNNMSAKAGAGSQGFDFTRLDLIGDEVDDETSTWHCVRDNITGLIWESKASGSSSGLHSSRHRYSWYQSNDVNGFDGAQNGTSTRCSIGNCNTENYIAEVNSQGLCNFRDWRLPTHNELLSILHLGKTTAPMIDTDYFPYTGTSQSSALWYWTQDASADGISNEQAHSAWAIDFASGDDHFLNKISAGRVRLVRAGR
ncbi:DUF1566 domain-containing protein [uncultured Paraglaciecola sp.]|uniref:Lcl C-terminal domain-containing protein n=1 Tax=uncultured Paraglaciecola sp. TaxID=1765024 RepID=UPI00261E42A6|nr:DUF1566 domain-containing protein [uncultured Paraglaciecola sp.]